MPTYHFLQNQEKLLIQSRENGQKPCKIANFSEKQVSFKLKVIFNTNFWPKTKNIVIAAFERNNKVSDFGLI